MLLLTACNSDTYQSESLIPAKVAQPNDASRQELQHTISSALNLPKVLLSEDALTHSNVLIIEQSRLLNEMSRPNIFRLFKSGSQCILVLQGTNKRWILENIQCESVHKPSSH